MLEKSAGIINGVRQSFTHSAGHVQILKKLLDREVSHGVYLIRKDGQAFHVPVQAPTGPFKESKKLKRNLTTYVLMDQARAYETEYREPQPIHKVEKTRVLNLAEIEQLKAVVRLARQRLHWHPLTFLEKGNSTFEPAEPYRYQRSARIPTSSKTSGPTTVPDAQTENRPLDSPKEERHDFGGKNPKSLAATKVQEMRAMARPEEKNQKPKTPATRKSGAVAHSSLVSPQGLGPGTDSESTARRLEVGKAKTTAKKAERTVREPTQPRTLRYPPNIFTFVPGLKEHYELEPDKRPEDESARFARKIVESIWFLEHAYEKMRVAGISNPEEHRTALIDNGTEAFNRLLHTDLGTFIFASRVAGYRKQVTSSVLASILKTDSPGKKEQRAPVTTSRKNIFDHVTGLEAHYAQSPESLPEAERLDFARKIAETDWFLQHAFQRLRRAGVANAEEHREELVREGTFRFEKMLRTRMNEKIFANAVSGTRTTATTNVLSRIWKNR